MLELLFHTTYIHATHISEQNLFIPRRNIIIIINNRQLEWAREREKENMFENENENPSFLSLSLVDMAIWMENALELAEGFRNFSILCILCCCCFVLARFAFSSDSRVVCTNIEYCADIYMLMFEQGLNWTFTFFFTDFMLRVAWQWMQQKLLRWCQPHINGREYNIYSLLISPSLYACRENFAFIFIFHSFPLFPPQWINSLCFPTSLEIIVVHKMEPACTNPSVKRCHPFVVKSINSWWIFTDIKRCIAHSRYISLSGENVYCFAIQPTLDSASERAWSINCVKWCWRGEREENRARSTRRRRERETERKEKFELSSQPKLRLPASKNEIFFFLHRATDIWFFFYYFSGFSKSKNIFSTVNFFLIPDEAQLVFIVQAWM